MLTSENFRKICKNCQAFCCKLVLPPVTPQERYRILKAGHPDHFTQISSDVYQIQPTETGWCPYLSADFSCSIQEVKPTLCTIWPVIPHEKRQQRGAMVVKCPLYPHLSSSEINHAQTVGKTIPSCIIKHLWALSEETKNKYKTYEYEEL